MKINMGFYSALKLGSVGSNVYIMSVNGKFMSSDELEEMASFVNLHSIM